MGRPLNKKFFGLLDDGTNIKVNCQIGSNAESEVGYILRQRSSKRFLVNDKRTGTNKLVGDTESGNSQGNVGVCQLVDKADGALAANEMSIMGYTSNGTGIRIAKLSNKIVVDFNGNRYKWSVVNDSTTSLISLTTP
jgi:hypothetical protein